MSNEDQEVESNIEVSKTAVVGMLVLSTCEQELYLDLQQDNCGKVMKDHLPNLSEVEVHRDLAVGLPLVMVEEEEVVEVVHQ